MPKKRLLLLLLFMILINGTALAGNNSTYNLNVVAREDSMDLRNIFNIDYQQVFGDYTLRGRVNLSFENDFPIARSDLEDNSIYELLWDDFHYRNYSLQIRREKRYLNLGITSSSNLSSFISSGTLEGTYFSGEKTEFWYGRPAFGTEENRRLGAKYDLGNSRVLGYQLDRNEVITTGDEDDRIDHNHYLSYQDRYRFFDSVLNLDTAVAYNQETELVGEAVDLNFASRLRGVSYNLAGNYESPDFQAVKSNLNRGYGRYRIDLRGHEQVGDFLVKSRSNYSRNNLSGEAEVTNKNWGQNFQINYYTDHVYQLDFDYRRNNDYKDGIREDKEERYQLGLGYNRQIARYNLRLTHNRENNKAKSNRLLLNAGFDPEPWRLTGNYQVIQDDGLEHDFIFETSYRRQLREKLDYDSNLRFNLNSQSATRVNLSQGLSYPFKDNHNLRANLNLGYNHASSDLTRSLRMNYRYNF
ncbi:hypothetical protein MWH28_02980 [Natroniella sulfidigena]|uniref:hypothetical protein n=1 Tax=Natroniella sulfidigena TaxID=723921 RepID=UPI00200B73F6|nr:hypothetical protein [Natroniella sulfidigena]MCK8816327.1 hypothetical protein [Natroniella sulfidigena]